MALMIDQEVESRGGDGALGAIGVANAPASAQTDLRQFDLSPQAIQSAVSRGNVLSDIQSAYQTFLTGSPTGRGGRYAVSAQKQYGYSSIQEAAAAYLQAAGLRFVDSPQATLEIRTPAPVPKTVEAVTETVKETVKTPFEILADVFGRAFGQAVYNPPLQSQAYGYTPERVSSPVKAGGGVNIGLIIILAVIAIIGYFLFKRFA